MRPNVASIAVVLCLAPPAWAQLELPDASPLARVMQRVGLTDIQVEYSSPAASGRDVWGKLVPYGEVWRTGANANTFLEVSRPVRIGGVDVPAGKYSLHTVPGQLTWTVIVNRKTDGWGSDTYDRSQDVVRTEVTAQKVPPRERLAFLFSNTTRDRTELDLEWAGVRVRVPIGVKTKEQVEEGINRAVGGLWRPSAQAARYLFETEKDVGRALALVDQSIAIEPTWFNLWTKARILGEKGDKDTAAALAEQALEKGDGGGAFRFYSPQMREAIARWRRG